MVKREEARKREITCAVVRVCEDESGMKRTRSRREEACVCLCVGAYERESVCGVRVRGRNNKADKSGNSRVVWGGLGSSRWEGRRADG